MRPIYRRSHFVRFPAVAIVAAIVGVVGVIGWAAASPPVDDVHERQVMIALGGATFQHFCAPCHGTNGRGSGPVSLVIASNPLDLTGLAKSRGGRFPVEFLEEELRAGVGDAIGGHAHSQMPALAPVFISIDGSIALAHARLANLIAYIESIQR